MNDMMRLVEPLIPALRRYARSLLRDQAAADDLVQYCLERVITRWHQRRADGDVRTWTFTILHNLAMNQLRRSARRAGDVPIDNMDEVFAAQRPEQEDGLRVSDTLTALGRLSKELQSVLLLVSVEELSYAETAAVLSIPVGTVMSRLSRARDRLQSVLDADSVATRSHLRRVK